MSYSGSSHLQRPIKHDTDDSDGSSESGDKDGDLKDGGVRGEDNSEGDDGESRWDAGGDGSDSDSDSENGSPPKRVKREEEDLLETDDESDERPSKIARKYMAQQRLPGSKYSPQQMKSNFNRLVLNTIKKGLGVQLLYQVVSVEPVSEEDLRKFDAGESKPKVTSFKLDTRGETAKELLRLAWNATLEKLVWRDIWRKVKPKLHTGKYGAVTKAKVKKGVHERFSRMFRAIARTVVLDGQTWEEFVESFTKAHHGYNERSRHLMMRHTKLDLRIRYATIMRLSSQQVQYKPGEQFWSYVLEVIKELGYDGMSDEESDTEEMTRPNNFKVNVRYRKVLKLRWRHPSIEALFAKVDETPKLAKAFFHTSASSPANRLRRVRVDKESTRDPPKNIPRSLYNPEYLDSLGAPGEYLLDVSDRAFELYNLDVMNEVL
ncbi:hypothetical protein HDZ31DRAFT_70280 [Schizophyllum fasciatum]